jgi:hypothetical protein
LGEVPFTLANIIPPMKAADLVRQVGLGERWANVRLPYFLSEKDDRVYLVGDIAGNTPYPKSGMVAYVSGTIVARQIAERLKGKPLAEIPPELPTNICYSFVRLRGGHLGGRQLLLGRGGQADQGPELRGQPALRRQRPGGLRLGLGPLERHVRPGLKG